jgi:acyl-CoA thioesterase-2
MIEPTTFDELIRLDDQGADTWIGGSPRYTWGRIYGGQVVAQALWAASRTVDEAFVAHSLHAYFIRGGSLEEPVQFEVDRLRNGRSFCTRAVVARQSAGAILNLSCSFQRHEDDADVQTARMPLAPDPDDIRSQRDNWPWIMDRRPLEPYPGAGQSMGWVRLTDPLPDDPVLHRCGLAFTSDTIQFGSAHSIHPLQVPPDQHTARFMGASLDHAMWFHRPARADRWHLYQWDCHGLRGARGMTVGNLFTPDGTHVASIAQEVLLRERRLLAATDRDGSAGTGAGRDGSAA